MIKLTVEPRKTYTWADFKATKPSHSIALDGFVVDGVKRDPHGPYANFDHHTCCDRLSTRSTAEQVHMEINLGLFSTFQKDGIPYANIFANDPDADTCLSVWLLWNHERVVGHAEPCINRLVYCVDRLDCTAGLYPLGGIEIARKMAWIFEPYYSARFDGSLSNMTAGQYKAIIEAVGARITSYSLGKAGEAAFDGGFDIIGGGNGWSFVKERGIASRSMMLDAGIQAFATMVQDRGDGSFTYSIGRSSVWVPFCLEGLYKHLNEIEKDLVSECNAWGGSDTIGGSPRSTGSRLSLQQLENAINDFLKSER